MFSDLEFYVLRRLYARSSGFRISTEVYVKKEFSELLLMTLKTTKQKCLEKPSVHIQEVSFLILNGFETNIHLVSLSIWAADLRKTWSGCRLMPVPRLTASWSTAALSQLSTVKFQH
jgi:hypothetical protein